nr:hypothetical protein [Hepelivirales sp.]WAY16473.1 hypothetical protein [Hepelivirales sp.]
MDIIKSENKFFQLVNDSRRRQDNLVQLTDPITSIHLKILTQVHDQDSSGWYGLGTIIDLVIPHSLDFIIEIFVFLERINELTRIVPPSAHFDTKYNAYNNTYRFIDHFINIDPDLVIEAFRDATQAKTAPKWRQELKETYQQCAIKVQNMQQNVQRSELNKDENNVLQGVQGKTLGEDPPQDQPNTHSETETTETAISETFKNRGNIGKSLSCNVSDRQQNFEIRSCERPQLPTRSLCDRKTSPLSPRSIYSMWTATYKSKRRPSPIAKVSDTA